MALMHVVRQLNHGRRAAFGCFSIEAYSCLLFEAARSIEAYDGTFEKGEGSDPFGVVIPMIVVYPNHGRRAAFGCFSRLPALRILSRCQRSTSAASPRSWTGQKCQALHQLLGHFRVL
jgi:hypothetical protein